jgi:hypothetical protein
MAKKSTGENTTTTNTAYERLHFSDTKTWQHARDIYVKVIEEINTFDEVPREAEILRNHLIISLENASLRIAHSINSLSRDAKKHFFHQAIEQCVAAQNHILLASAASFFDLTSFNEELTILIRQIAAGIGHLNKVDNPSQN